MQGTVVGANRWGKWKTVIQLSAIAGLLVPPLWNQAPHWILTWFNETGMLLFWISLPMTLISAYTYLRPTLAKSSHHAHEMSADPFIDPDHSSSTNTSQD